MPLSLLRRYVKARLSMPAEPSPPDDPGAWLRRARSNLLHAKARTPGVYFEDLCFDAQQAAEKALKAVLVKRGVKFPYVHDLATLVTLVGQAGEDVPLAVREAGRLTRLSGRRDALPERGKSRCLIVALLLPYGVEKTLTEPE